MANSGALFLAYVGSESYQRARDAEVDVKPHRSVSKEQDASQNHDLVVDGDNIGRYASGSLSFVLRRSPRYQLTGTNSLPLQLAR